MADLVHWEIGNFVARDWEVLCFLSYVLFMRLQPTTSPYLLAYSTMHSTLVSAVVSVVSVEPV